MAEVLTYCDLHGRVCGERIAASARLSDVVARHGADDPVGRAVKRSQAELLSVVKWFSWLQ